MTALTHCFRCDASYDPAGEWYYGFNRKNDTSPAAFKVYGKVRAGDCPICQKPPILEPPEAFVGSF